MKAIMYHYVRPEERKLKKLNYLHIDDFKKQLDFFHENYGLISKEDFLKVIKKEDEITKHKEKIILTFDDGLICHYKYILPELEKRGFWGIFYIPTTIYKKNKILDVHRIHILLATIDPKEIYSFLIKKIKENMIKKDHKEKFSNEIYSKQKNDEFTKKVKEILNYYIDYNYRENIIDECFEKFELNKLFTVEDFYVNQLQIKEMISKGMIIGSHSENHPVMSKLTKEEQRKEIVNSFEYLESIEKQDIKTFCYPYGGSHSYTQETIDILNNERSLFSFDVNHRNITKYDLEKNVQNLPRFDCNQFPYGQVRSIK